MPNIIGGYDTGLFDSSLFLLNRNDRTAQGTAGHGEELYVNIANGNLVVMHKDAFLPSQGEDYMLVRTYNSRGTWNQRDGMGWSNNSTVLELSQITNNQITLISADTSRAVFRYDAASDSYISVDGAGAYEVIKYDKAAKTYSLTKSNQTVWGFDINGDLKFSRDTNGNLIEYTFSQGRLQSLKDDTGHVLTYSYSNGNLMKVTDETGVVLVSYEYAQNLITSVTDRAGLRTSYSYYTDGAIKSITLPAAAGEQQRVLSFEYDPDPTDSTGKTRLLRWLTDAEGNRTYFEYSFNVDNFSKYNGGSTVVVNALGLNRRESNAAEFVQWRLDNGYYASWDAARYASDATFRAQADAITSRHTVTYAYDRNGEITGVVDQAGYRTGYRYDAQENLVAIIDANGDAITRSDDPYWRELRREYGHVDAAGQGKRVAELSAADIAALLERYTTHLEYDSRGNLLRRTDNADNLTSFTYTAFNKVASQTAAMGWALTTANDALMQDKRAELGYARDVAALSAADKAALLALYTTSYTYDARQNVVEVKSPGGDLTRFEYDSYGNLTRRIVFLDASNLVDPAKQQVTQYFYDAYGQNIRTVDAEGYTTLNTYDHFGNLTSRTDGRGGVSRFTYDNNNQLLTSTDPEGHTTVYTYDSVGNRIAVRDANGHSVVYVYDRNNLLVTTIDPKDGDPAGNRVTQQRYDVVGNRTQLTDAEGRTTRYVYREDNRLLEVHTTSVQDAAGSGSASYVASYEYDGVGNAIAVTDFNGNRSQFVFDQDGLLKRQTDAIGNVTEYRYDANLNQIQVVIGAQLAADRRRVLRFSFDEEDQRIAEADALGGVTSYRRDAVGNVVATTDANGHTTEFRFDRNNRLVTQVQPGVADPASGQIVRHTVSHQYDGNGNEVAVTDENGHTTRLSYDKDDRLILVEDANGIKTAYGYDSRHNRTSIAIGVQASLDASGHVVIGDAAQAQVQTFAYDEFNQIVSRTDGVGNALAGSNDPLYRALRQQMGFAADVAALSAADKQALLAAYTDRFTYDKVGNLVTATDHLGRTTRMAYDGLNRELNRTDALGGVTRQRYDGNGNRVALVDANGHEIKFAYDAVNRLVSQTDALGVVTTSSYDHVGNLLQRTQAAGTGDARTVKFVYDLNDRLVQSTDAEGVSQSYEYDAVGNRLQVVDGRGNATRYVYDARNRLVQAIDPLGFQTRVQYDGVGNRIALIDARGGITRVEYDAGNRVVTSTDAEGRVSRFEYDVRGNRIVQRTAAGTPEEQVTHFEYDAQNNLRAVVDAEGHRSSSDFDRVYNRVAATDGNGHTTHYGFDALNRQISVVDAEGHETRYAYDAVGNVLSQTDALGRLTSYAYDANNRSTTVTAADGVVTAYSYDRVGNRITVTEAAGLPEQRSTVYAYDLNNRLLSQTDALGHATRYEYDANGNTVARIDPMGHRTAYEYDANNRVVRIVDPMGHAVAYAYDGNGNRVQVTDALGHTSTSYYNLDNELVLAVDNEGYATGFSYDHNGNVVAQTRYARALALPVDPAVRPVPSTDPRDQTVRMRYDRLNRVVERLDGEGFATAFGYDAVGNMLSITRYLDLARTRGETTRNWYDATDRLVAQLSAEGTLSESAYDAVGNRVSATRRSQAVAAPADGSRPAPAAGDAGVTSLYAYDAVNRLVTETDALGTVTRNEYNALGERTATVLADGTAEQRRTDYRYDAAGRLTDEINALGVRTHYELDADDRITARYDAFGSGDEHRSTFEYDANHRLVRSTDALGVVTQQSHDANGNLLARTVGAGLAGARTETFEYDRANRLTAHRSAMGERTAFALDATGNRVAVTDALGRTTDYRFDRNNQLVLETKAAVQDASGQWMRHTVSHQYDGAGNRVAVTDENGHTTRFAYDLDNRQVLVQDGNGIETVFSYDARNNLLAAAVGVQAHVDAAGRVVVDGFDEAQVTSFAYDAVNRQVARTDGVGNALAASNGALYRTLRQQMGFAADASQLSAADKQALQQAYTDRFGYDRLGNQTSATDHLGRTTTAAFDTLGRLVSRTDAAGGVQAFGHDVHNRLVAQTDALGRNITLAYDAMNRLVSQTDALGVTTTSSYDHVGNLLQRTQAAGTGDARTVQFVYDLDNRLLQSTDAEGVSQSYEYDAVGNRLQVVDGRGNATRYVYDARNRLVQAIDPLGFQTRVQYDGVGNRIALIDARGGITRVEYDAGNRVVTSTDAEGRVSRFEYDVRGNRIVQRTAAGTPEEQVTHFEYDAQNNLRAVVDAEGNRSSSDFDRVYNRIAATDGNGHTTHYGFDALNRQISVVDAEGHETRYAYDAVGNVLSQTDALGRLTSYAYDANNRSTTVTAADGVVTAYSYDRVGNRITVTEAAGLPEQRSTVYAYDLDNRLLSQTDALGHATRYEFDANGNTVARIDPLGHRTAYEYDANNRVVRIVDPMGHAVAYAYDGNGNRVQVSDELGRVSTTYYNLDNEATLAVNAEGEATSYQYDANGNRIAETRHATRVAGAPDPAQAPAVPPSPEDQTTRTAYDRLNRAVRVVDGEGHVVDSVYDAVGNVLRTVAYATPVQAGGPVAGLLPPPSAKDRTTRFAYDSVNRRIERIDAEGYTTQWRYDAVGNRTEQLQFLDQADRSNPALQQRTVSFYDALNRLVSQTDAVGVETRFSYDALGQQTARIDAAGRPEERQTLNRYDAAGRLLEQQDAEGTVTRYERDAAGQLRFEIQPFGRPEARSTERRYDDAGRVVEEVRPDGTLTRLAYDVRGNLLARTDAAGSAAERVSTYAYDRADRLVLAAVGAGSPEALVTRYELDAFGNRTQQVVAEGTADERRTRFAYDHLNRLIAQTDGNHIVTLHDHDAFGNRVATRITGRSFAADGTALDRTQVETFEYDGRNLLIRQENGEHEVIRRAYDGAGNLRFQVDGEGSSAAATTEFRYDLANRLTDKIVDPAGLALKTSYAYDARGNLVRETNADGFSTETRFDRLDRALQTTDAEGFSASFNYDRFGNQTAITTGQYLVPANDPQYDAAKAARALPATTRIAYDAMNRKTLQADALGTVTRYAYDERGNRTQQVEAFGVIAAGADLALANVQPLAGEPQRISRYAYDAVDRLREEVQPLGTVIRYGYTAAGEQREKVVDFGVGPQFRNATTRWGYDAGGRMVFEADPVGSVTQTRYDDFGNRVQMRRGMALDAAGLPVDTADTRVTAYEFDQAHRTTAEMVDPQGLAIRTAYEYDARGNRVAVIDGNGARSDMAYDKAGRAVWQRDAEGHVSVREYNGRGLQTAEVLYANAAPAGAPAGSLPAPSTLDRRSTAAYDAAGRAVETTDARGVVTRVAYDAIGNRTAVTENATGLYGSAERTTRYAYNLANLVTQKTDASGLVTHYAYDAVYNNTEKRVENRWLDTLNRDANGQPVPRVELQVTAYAYDLNNRLTDQVVDPNGLNLHRAWRYDSLGNQVAEVAANGFAAAETDSDWALQARRALGLVDGAGQPLRAAQLSAEQRHRVLDAYTTRTWYDAASRAVMTVDANGHARSAAYDAVGNLVRTVQHAQPLSAAQLAALDDLHAPAPAADAADRTVEHGFDKADREVLVRTDAARQFVDGAWVDGYRAEMRKAYDAVGNLLRETDANGNTTYRYYDAARRLSGMIDAAGYLTVVERDAFGNATRERLLLDVQALSASQKAELDLAHYTPAGEARVVEHEYDAADHELRTVYPPADLYEGGAHLSERLQVLRTIDAFGQILTESVRHRVGQAAAPATRYQYDDAGRLVAKTDARGDEQPGQDYTCTYAYDAVGNLREQVEGERVVSFEYDSANRSVRVHYPAVRRAEVDADGNVVITDNYRAVALRSHDANGNVLTELKPDGVRVDARFDRANRQVAVFSNGTYADYSYNFAGDLTGMHRYHAAATSVDQAPAADTARDQVVAIEVDKLGRKVAEVQRGSTGALADGDRVMHYGYDANGNQVLTVDARGNATTVVFDALNRIVGTVNREGGISQTRYDAMGNVVARQTGGWSAPQLVGGLREDLVSDRGAVIEWSTDHPSDGIVYLRPAGGSAFTAFGLQGSQTLDHSVALSGLAASSDYEYYIVSKDPFGYELTSEVRSFRTSVGLDAVAVDNVQATASGLTADLHFAVPAGATGVRVLVGSGSAGSPALDGAAAFSVVQQPDGSYSASIAGAADAMFQVEWTDAQGVHRTGASALQQRVETHRLDASVVATPQGSNYGLTVSWNLADVLAEIESSGSPATYSVFIGFAADATQAPRWQTATLENGQFTTTFDNLREGARTLYLQYQRADGSMVNASPLAVSQLAGLNQRVQNLDFSFPDTDTTGAQLQVRTRATGTSDWMALPASAISGLSANLLGLAKGGYEYEATLVRGGTELRKASGSFTMRTPAAITGLADARNAGAVAHTIDDHTLELPGLLPVGADETVTATLTDAQGTSTAVSMADGKLNLKPLHSGSYTLHVVKTRTTSTTAGTPPVTTTTTTTLNDISGTLVIGELLLSDVQSAALQGSRSVTSYAIDAARTVNVSVTVGGSSSADHSWNHFDDNGLRLFSNENGGVWTRYFHDAQGNVTKEVRFQRRDANGNFIDQIADEADRPSLAQLVADYDAALAAGPEHVRVTTRSYDAVRNKLSETESSAAHGAVTTRWEYDRFNNKVREVSAQGIAGLENDVRTAYDAFNRVLRVETGGFAHLDEAGNQVNSGAVEGFAYDGRGNKTLHTDARGFEERFHYDGNNRLATQWDGRRAGAASMLRTDFFYDAFDRIVEQRATDLTGRATHAVQSTRYEWSVFDQLRSFTDNAGHTVRREYDANGNQVRETDAMGRSASFEFNAENKLLSRTDRLGATWGYTYDAYGQKLSEVDANGRLTTYQLGAFGQILGSETRFIAGYTSAAQAAAAQAAGEGLSGWLAALVRAAAAAAGGTNYLGGEGSMSDTSRYDWLGRLADVTDSFGKHLQYGYNDADEQIRVADLTNGQAVDYGYDALGRRTEETHTRNGLVWRHQTNHYNNQGWLTGVEADASYDAGGGASIDQRLNVAYAFDAAGNRVRVGDGQYAYDAAGRMTRGFDGKKNEVVNDLSFDGFGNRISESRAGSTTTYSYDELNRVRTSSAGEEWRYDDNGNLLFQRSRDGNTSTSEFNAENRATRTVSTADGKTTTSVNRYDAVGNVVNTRIDGDGYGFDEVTQRDVRYLERSKRVANSYAKGAKGLDGSTSFAYDSNGNLTMVDRGRKQGSNENSVAFFEYDLEGHIVGRSDKASALTSADFFAGYLADPDAAPQYDEYGYAQSVTQQVQQQLFGGGSGATTKLQSYLYANNKPISEASGDQVIGLKKLTLTGGEAVTETVNLGGDNGTTENTVGWRITLQADDIVRRADGSIDRTATAQRVAGRVYAGFSDLSSGAQAKVAGYVQGQLPPDAELQAGAKVNLHGFILVADASYANLQQVTDYSLRQLGADGANVGTVQTHQVRAGETLQSIAAVYFGSPSYWYLIADANGLQGTEPLAEGTVLKIPATVSNSVNDANTFKVYNESEIIGSTSPEIRTIKKKKKWWQKLIMVVIVVIMIVAAVITAGAALAAVGALAAGTGGLLGVGAALAGSIAAATGVTLGALTVGAVAVAAVAGALVYTAASIITQGLAVAADLQEKFSWKQVGKSALSGAISGAAGALTAGLTKGLDVGDWRNVAARVSVEVGKQYATDGKITNVAGIIGAAATGGAFKGLGEFGKYATEYSRTFGAGLSLLENKVRGRGDNALSWVSLATSAVFDSGMLQDADGYKLRDNLTAASGKINWQYLAVHAIGTAIVADRMGEDAALNYVGSAIGNGIASDSYREMGRVTTRTLQLKTLDAAKAAHPEKAEALDKLRERVLAGEENLAFDIEDASKMEVKYKDEKTGEEKSRTANAIYRENGRISINRDLLANANTPEGTARLLGAISEEVGEWAARKEGLEFYNDAGRKLDAGAVLGLQTMTSLSAEAGFNQAPVMFALDSSEGRYDFSTDASSLVKVSVNQFTSARMLANVQGSFGDAQVDWKQDLKDLAVQMAEKLGDNAVLTAGMVVGVGKKGLEAVKGLAQLAGDALGTSAYLNLKMAGADRWAEKLFGGSYRRMNALIDTTVKFVKENSVGKMAYEIFAKPLADGYKHSRDALLNAERVARGAPKTLEGYVDRAAAFFEAGEELGKFGVDIALAVLSVTGAGAAAKSLFNVGTALGSRLAGRLAVSRGAGAASAIESLAGEVSAAARAEAAERLAAAEANLARAEQTAGRSEQVAARAEQTAATAARVRRFEKLEDFNRAANAAEPNTVYEFGNYRWATDGKGRVARVEGRVDLAKHGRQTTDGVDTTSIGKSADAQAGDVGFHLVGDQFNGPINRLNVVPGNGVTQGELKALNLSGYKRWENKVAELAREGNVEIRIQPSYSPTNVTTRPDAFRASYRVEGGQWITREFLNKAGG